MTTALPDDFHRMPHRPAGSVWRIHPLDILWVSGVLLLVPSVCWAWGPGAHLDFGLQVLDGLLLLPPVLRRLLRRNRREYLYGSVAADMVVGKNMARQPRHCHNWSTGLTLLAEARTDPDRSLALGFLSHLAADTVAHTYFVPAKTVESFLAPATRHTYWEIRYDQLTHARARVWGALQDMANPQLPEQAGFLTRHLARSSVLFPIGTSRRIFDGLMRLTSADGWRRTTAAMADRSPWKVEPPEAREVNRLAVEAIFSTLNRWWRGLDLLGDPTGRSSLGAATQLRRELKHLHRRCPIRGERWVGFFELVRRGFREALDQPLTLPSLTLLAQAA